jgi:3-isopropylmalate/(R)-2-methylmalate dehydratase small subunit
MPRERIVRVVGRGVHLAGDDIDTDRIMPARFLRCVTFDGLGEHVFEDDRRDAQRRPTGHPLDDPRFAGAAVLVSGRNFGCGSSREHAPQALARYGFTAIVAESFADIFFANATTLGLPCASVEGPALAAIADRIEREPSVVLALDLRAERLTVGEDPFSFHIKEAARRSLIEGLWDPLDALLDRADVIDAAARRLPYVDWTRPGPAG